MAEITMYDVEVEASVDIDGKEINLSDLSYVSSSDVRDLVHANPDEAYDFMTHEVERCIESGEATQVVQPVLERLMDLLGAGVIKPDHLPEKEAEPQDPTIEQAVDIIAAALKDLLVGKQEKDMTNELTLIHNN